jgi:RNA polymerase sigma factor (sigma-70 family)
MSSPVPSPEFLLERARCVSTLARAVAQGADASEDVAQDALLASLGRGAPDEEALPNWLARKVRSLAHRARRAAARRTGREQAAARPEALPSASELVERAWLQRTLVEAVVALDEPYRSVVLLRYFEDLPPREIARLREQPVRTIQTQLARALSQLRARLDRKLGPRTWAALVTPLAASGSSGARVDLALAIQSECPRGWRSPCEDPDQARRTPRGVRCRGCCRARPET